MRAAGVGDVAVPLLVLVFDELVELALPRILVDLGLLHVVQVESQIVQQGEASLGHLRREGTDGGPLGALVEVLPLGLAPFAQISILGGNVDGTMDALVLDEAGILASPVIVLGGPPGGGTPRRDGIHLALGLDLDGDGLGELLLDALDLGLGLLDLHDGLGTGLVGGGRQWGAAPLAVGRIATEAEEGGTGRALNERKDVLLGRAGCGNDRSGDGQDLISGHDSQRFGMVTGHLLDVNLESLGRRIDFESKDNSKLGFAEALVIVFVVENV